MTEIPYGVQKSRLIERLAEVVTEKKSPLIADVRDESAEDVRVVIEPRSRTVDARVLMEHLFRLTELEARISLNLNVLVDGVVPRVIGLRRGAEAMARSSPRRAGPALAPPARARSTAGSKCWPAC